MKGSPTHPRHTAKKGPPGGWLELFLVFVFLLLCSEDPPSIISLRGPTTDAPRLRFRGSHWYGSHAKRSQGTAYHL